mgnify:CR=1 FL=1|tara:strand:+ start:4157 stop:4510 length:354 start_codon:yes stop_codon:yes gene_type:complete
MTDKQKAMYDKLYKEGRKKGLSDFVARRMAQKAVANVSGKKREVDLFESVGPRYKGGGLRDKTDVTNIVGMLSRRREIEKARKKKGNKFIDPDFSSVQATTYDEYDKSDTDYKKKKR